MNSKRLAGIVAGLSVMGAVAAYAQFHPQNGNASNQYPGTKADVPAAVHATVKDPAGPTPNPKQIPFLLPKDIKWRPNGPAGTKPGEADIANVYGDPAKPGPYMVMYKWYPGNFSKPHYHNNERFAYVVSGTWWTSTSKVYDERTTYPVHAGSVAVDKLKGIHWDGARLGEKEPAILVLAGTGPNITQGVDENGKDSGPPR